MKIVEINADEAIAQFDAILLSDKDFAKEVKKIIRKELSKARNEISKDTKEVIDYDPRQAYRAVRRVIYKRVLGGNINILRAERHHQQGCAYRRSASFARVSEAATEDPEARGQSRLTHTLVQIVASSSVSSTWVQV